MTTADAYPFPTLPAPLRFAIALTFILLVYVAARWTAVVDDGSYCLLLAIAVMSSAWFAGTGPALAATVLGAVLGAFDAREQIAAGAASAPMHLALFLVQGLLLTAVVAELRSARRAAERRRMEAESARRDSDSAGRLKDEFLATISHELRTPLNAVLGWVQLLRTTKLDAVTAGRGLESIDRNIRLQSRLMVDLLDVAQSMTGVLQLESQPSSVTAAAHQAIEGVEATARAKDVVLSVDLPDAPAIVLGDSTRLRQIVWQLLINAIKFTPRGGSVDLAIELEGDEAVLTVRDTGPGIDPEFLPRLFESFSQADQSPMRTAGGLGVGLSLVRDLVELHGGRIRAENRRDRDGAVFFARFPLHTSPPIEAASPGLRVPVESAYLEGLRVLVLDHDSDAREMVRTALQQRGASVQTAASVAEALESLESWSPDVLVSDTGASHRDCYALIGRVRSLDPERGGRIPALALTSVARTHERLGSLMATAHCDIPKPVEPSVLTAEIARLGRRERRRAAR
jgi:signal transduction histidine kinase/CheY-like chemotaxis protein